MSTPMAVAPPTQQDRPVGRRSDRVRLRLRVQVTGLDLAGKAFIATVRTEVVTRHGGSIVVRQSLVPDQELTLQIGDREIRARVVGQVGIDNEGHVYGVAFAKPSERFWGIAFPAVGEPDETVGRTLLQCGACHGQEVVHLDEIEVMVFEANRNIARHCSVCRDSTLWKQADEHGRAILHRDASGALVPREVSDTTDAAAGSLAEPPAVLQPRARNKNERKHPRLSMKNAKACIQLHGQPDDIVRVVDVSRGGLRFHSSVKYKIGTWVQVAVPFTPGSGNIFMSARVVRIQPPTAEAPGEFALEYAAPK